MNAAIKRWPWATAAMTALALGAFAWPGVQSAWVLDRAAVQRGELWRWWTGQFVHFGASHLGWNLAIFVVAGAWVERVATDRARIYFALAPAAIGVVLLGFDPTLARYGGLSGLTAGTVALLAFTHLARAARDDRWFWWAVLGLLLAKIAVEFFREQAVFAQFGTNDIRVVPLAHLAGVAGAAAVSFTRRKPAEK